MNTKDLVSEIVRPNQNRMILRFHSNGDWSEDMDTITEIIHKATKNHPDTKIDVEANFQKPEKYKS